MISLHFSYYFTVLYTRTVYIVDIPVDGEGMTGQVWMEPTNQYYVVDQEINIQDSAF